MIKCTAEDHYTALLVSFEDGKTLLIQPDFAQQAFIKDSFIPIIPINISNLVAMPYIPNENFYDILAGRIGLYSVVEKKTMIEKAIDVVKEMHSREVVWGELITPNMIRELNGKIIICDTETAYYRGSLIEQKSSYNLKNNFIRSFIVDEDRGKSCSA